ncbi:TmcC family electron transfer complex membrane anchor subunit [Thermodesulfobacteriota bacterium]
MDFYELVRGPLAWFAFLVFLFGCLGRICLLWIIGKKERLLYPYRSFKDGFRSILHGLIPFGATYMRERPLFTIITFSFHLCVLIVPVFLLAHTILWYESWGILWWNLPDTLADIMTILVILSCIYFFSRRLIVPEVKRVSNKYDILFLLMVLLPFLTGFLAYHQWGPYRPMLILHILSGEILLISIPFSRLIHMILFPFTRAYMGAEFGKALSSGDW